MNSNQPAVNVEILLKAADVAERLNICRSMAYRLLKTNAIPNIRIGQAVRVLPTDLEAYIEASRTADDKVRDSYHSDSLPQPQE